MPLVNQTYVTQIFNRYAAELSDLDLLEHFSPVSAFMSLTALAGLQSSVKKEKLNSQIQQIFTLGSRKFF